MHKILLVIDDYTELEITETLLKRIGFDVLALSKEVLVQDALLRFPADVILATFKGRNVDGARIAQKLKTSKTLTGPRVGLLKSAQGSEAPSPHADFVIETPWAPTVFIQTLASVLKVEAAPLLRKHERASLAAASGAKRGEKDSSVVTSEREKRYEKFLAENAEPSVGHVPRTALEKAIRTLRDSETDADRAELKKLHAEKVAFTETLFRQATLKKAR